MFNSSRVRTSTNIFANDIFPVVLMDENWTHECHPCGLKFNNEKELLTHMELGHVYTKGKKMFNTQSLIVQQEPAINNQPNKKSLKCKFCPKTFKNRSSLSEHRWVHSEDNPPWKCEFCQKVFPFKTRLKKHQLTHIDINERSRKYECSGCEATFFRQNDLWAHEKAKGHRKLSQHVIQTSSHKMLKQSVYTQGYKCKDCDKTLASSGSLFNHRQSIHHGGNCNKRYSCQECPGKFSMKQKLISHLIRRHPKKDKSNQA